MRGGLFVDSEADRREASEWASGRSDQRELRHASGEVASIEALGRSLLEVVGVERDSDD